MLDDMLPIGYNFTSFTEVHVNTYVDKTDPRSLKCNQIYIQRLWLSGHIFVRIICHNHVEIIIR